MAVATNRHEQAMLALRAIPYRPDIDGLRAVAVLSVVAYHASPRLLSGGFVGVDVFFVISGFLISTIILREMEAGSFSLAGFYARRIRRLFPALIVVLAATLAIGWYFLLPHEFRALGRHMAAGAAYFINFTLKREAGYFDAAADEKPLLHLWSLAVEEQFYIVWPLLLLLIRKAASPPHCDNSDHGSVIRVEPRGHRAQCSFSVLFAAEPRVGAVGRRAARAPYAASRRRAHGVDRRAAEARRDTDRAHLAPDVGRRARAHPRRGLRPRPARDLPRRLGRDPGCRRRAADRRRARRPRQSLRAGAEALGVRRAHQLPALPLALAAAVVPQHSRRGQRCARHGGRGRRRLRAWRSRPTSTSSGRSGERAPSRCRQRSWAPH